MNSYFDGGLNFLQFRKLKELEKKAKRGEERGAATEGTETDTETNTRGSVLVSSQLLIFFSVPSSELNAFVLCRSVTSVTGTMIIM